MDQGQNELFRLALEAASTGMLIVEDAVAIAPRPAQAAPPAHILVIDDEPAVAKVILRFLGGLRVSVETDARVALARLASGEVFDVVLCDLMMPELTGADVYAAVHAANPRLASRIVFLTGGTFSRELTQFLDQVPNAVIDKPFTADQVRAAIAALLDGCE